MNCKCCNSAYRSFIESLLTKNISCRKISHDLKEKFNVHISHNSINNHRKYHWLPTIQERDDVIPLLYETGNYRLARSIEKTKKIIKAYPKCQCSPYLDRSLKRRGLIYLCSNCNGWLEGNIGRAIKHSSKRKEEDKILALPFSPMRREY